jgi:hypothetical protein
MSSSAFLFQKKTLIIFSQYKVIKVMSIELIEWISIQISATKMHFLYNIVKANIQKLHKIFKYNNLPHQYESIV